MIVKSLEKKNKYYLVEIDDEIYKFSEDTVVNYRLVKNKEIDIDTLSCAIKDENLNSYYEKAINYQIKYMKGRYEIYNYLLKKGLNNTDANLILDKMEKNKLLDDKNIIESLVREYIREKFGINIIKEKLKSKGFKFELIDDVLSYSIDDNYYNSLNKLYSKIKDKYNDEENYIRINKIKDYLYRRGYTTSDIITLDIR